MLRELCTARRAGIAHVVGRPGIGKTVLLDAALGRESRVLRGCAVRHDPDQLFATLRRLLRGRTLAPSEPQADLHERIMARYLAAYLHEQGRGTIVIDDAQWCDEASRGLLAAAADPRSRTVVLFAERYDDRDMRVATGADTMQIGPLEQRASRRLVHTLLPDADDRTVDEIVRAAAGIPFVIALLVDARNGFRIAALSRRLMRESETAVSLTRLVCAYDDRVPLSSLAVALACDQRTVAASLRDVSDLIVVEDGFAHSRHRQIAQLVNAEDAAHALTMRRAYDAERLVDDRSIDGLRRLRQLARAAARDSYVTISVELGTRLARERLHADAAIVLGEAYNAQPSLDGTAMRAYLDALRATGQEEAAVEKGQTAFHDALGRGDGLSAAKVASAVVHGLATLDGETEIKAFLSAAELAPAIASNAEAAAYLRSVALSHAAFGGELDRFDAIAAGADLSTRDQRAVAFVEALRGQDDTSDEAMASWRVSAPPWVIWDDNLEAYRRLLLDGTNRLREFVERTEGGGLDTAARMAFSAFYFVATAQWNNADRVLASIDPFAVAGDSRWVLLEVGLMLDALRRQKPRNAKPVRAELAKMIGNKRLRSAWGTAAWYVAAMARARGVVDAELMRSVVGGVPPWPRAWHLGALPFAAPFAGICLPQNAQRAVCDAFPDYGNKWARAHNMLARGLIDSDRETLRDARDLFDGLGAAGFRLVAAMALPHPDPADIALAQTLGYETEKRDLGTLTLRQLEIAHAAGRGCSSAELATEFGIAVSTVERHLTTIYRKTGTRNRTELGALFR